MILELIGEPYLDLKRNNSTNAWNKCLINGFIIDSLSSKLRDKTTHLSMQHCILCILEKISPSELNLTVIFQIIIKCDAHAQNSKFLFIYISAGSGSMLLK